jgi:hypothetical protein
MGFFAGVVSFYFYPEELTRYVVKSFEFLYDKTGYCLDNKVCDVGGDSVSN